MQKLLTFLAVVGMTVTLSTGVAFGAANGTNRPFNSRGSSVVTVTGLTTATVDSTFVSTLIGRGTSHEDLVRTSPTTYSDTSTVVAANGDEIFGSGTFDTTSSIQSTTFSGGTGRFADANGTVTTTATPLVPTDNPAVFTSTYTSTGMLSY